MDEEAQRELSRAIELVHNAQAELLENVSPPEDPAEVKAHLEKAVGMLVEAVRILGPRCGADVLTPSGYQWSLGFRKPA